jgi:hypothetical protein
MTNLVLAQALHASAPRLLHAEAEIGERGLGENRLAHEGGQQIRNGAITLGYANSSKRYRKWLMTQLK